GSPTFASLLVPLLRQWKTPLHEFQADVLGSALQRVNVRESTAAHVQILADALSLAQTNEQCEMAMEALGRAGDKMELAQLVAVPEVVRRLALGLARVATVTGDCGRVCEALLDIVERLVAVMAETRAQPARRDSRGKGGRWPGEVLASGMDQGVRLTPLHIECLKMCLLSKRRDLYTRAAASVVTAQFDSVGSMVAHRARSVMTYYLYAGMVCVGVGDTQRAMRMWQAVFALPSKHASAIQIAAYKRLTLVELEVSGKRARLAPFFAASHARTIESHAIGYVALAEAFAARTMAGVVAKMREMREALVSDGNLGLADRVLHMAPAHFVRRVGRAYARLSVGRLVELTGFTAHPLAARGDACAVLAQYIREMNDPAVALVDAAQGAAPRDAIVQFADPAATAAAALSPADRTRREELWAALLAEKAQEAEALRCRLVAIDRHLALTKENITSSRDQPTAT
ncbi:hypothetical protein LPJ61_005260, partial [Coemansia biformis]